MPKYFKIFVAIVVLHSISSVGQAKWSVSMIFDKTEKFYSGSKKFSYKMNYKLFKNKDSEIIIDEYNGLMIKNDKVSFQRMNKTDFINFDDYYTSVDHAQKTILIKKGKIQNPLISLKTLLKFPTKNQLIDGQKYWICEITSNKKNQNQFEQIKVYIHKKDFSLYKQVFYTKGSQEIEKNKKSIVLKDPRLEILYEKNEKSALSDNQLLKKENYFSIKNKKITLSQRFKTYRLITL